MHVWLGLTTPPWSASPLQLCSRPSGFCSVLCCLRAWEFALPSIWDALPLAFAELVPSPALSLKCLNVTLNVRETFFWILHLKWVLLVTFYLCTLFNFFMVYITIGNYFVYWLILGSLFLLLVCRHPEDRVLICSQIYLQHIEQAWHGAVLHVYAFNKWMHKWTKAQSQRFSYDHYPKGIMCKDSTTGLYLLHLPNWVMWALSPVNTSTTKNQEKGSFHYPRAQPEGQDEVQGSQCCSACLLLTSRLPTFSCWILYLSEPEMAKLPLDTKEE